ncbi:MAG: class I SAM-dependent methyltransferase [Pelagibacterales bacterium]|jgi:methylation protein EvaC|nr:class I SAM-dependent methyltransferase [Pelagibacterales bacterium]
MMKCKITDAEIKPFMSFGKMPIANGFLNKENFNKEFFFDLSVGFSEKISLFQLKDHPTPEQMFNSKYPFFSGSSEFMKQHFVQYSNFIKKNYLQNNSKIIEIGSNDGTCLKNFKDGNVDYIGFEPSSNVAELANINGIKTLNHFFNLNAIDLIKDFKKKTDVIYAANVICHVPDLKNLIKTIDALLSSDGVFIFEEPYLGSMFEKASYDQIYDEHIYIFSASSVKKVFELFDMDLINLIKQPTHGGSMRYIIGRKGKHKINKCVEEMLDEEKMKNLDNITSCNNFKKNCEESKKNLNTHLMSLKNEGKRIVGYGATSKSTTILNYCQINSETIEYICDTTKEKIGKFSPGMHIPIVSNNHFKNDNPDIAFLFAWNHKDEIFNKEKNFTKKNGKWISHVKI